MSNQHIYFGLIGVKPMKGNEILADAKGAYVHVACLSDSQTEFTKKVKDVFLHYKLEVFEIEDIETEKTLKIDNDENAGKLALLNEIKEGYSFAWGTFHSF